MSRVNHRRPDGLPDLTIIGVVPRRPGPGAGILHVIIRAGSCRTARSHPCRIACRSTRRKHFADCCARLGGTRHDLARKQIRILKMHVLPRSLRVPLATLNLVGHPAPASAPSAAGGKVASRARSAGPRGIIQNPRIGKKPAKPAAISTIARGLRTHTDEGPRSQLTSRAAHEGSRFARRASSA